MGEPVAKIELHQGDAFRRPGARGLAVNTSGLWLRVQRRGRAPEWYRVDHRSYHRALRALLDALVVPGPPVVGDREGGDRG